MLTAAAIVFTAALAAPPQPAWAPGGQIYDIRDPLPPDRRDLGLAGLLCGAAGATALTTAILRRRRVESPKVPQVGGDGVFPDPTQSPREQFLHLDLLLRRRMEMKNVPALRMSTEEILSQVKYDEMVTAELRDLLVMCDRGKFAREEPEPAVAATAREAVRSLLPRL